MISILLSCHKSNLEYLKEQLDSIMDQTEQDFEILLYNDGQEENEEFEHFIYPYVLSKKFRYFADGHKGYAKAYNFLLKKAKGEYVCFCDHDDIWVKDKLEIEKKYLDEHPDVDCVFGWLNWFGEKEKLESFSILDDVISKELYFYQPIKQPTTMFRKDRFGSFDAPFDKAGDFWFWAKHKDRHYHLIEMVLAHYRRHSGEATKDKTAFRDNSARVIQKSLKDRFGVTLHIDICKMLDPYSKTYNELMKKVIATLIIGKD